MTMDVLIDAPSIETRQGEPMYMQLKERMLLATARVGSELASALDTSPARLGISSATLAVLQSAILFEASRGVTGSLFQKALAIGGGTIAAYTAERFRNVYLQDADQQVK